MLRPRAPSDQCYFWRLGGGFVPELFVLLSIEKNSHVVSRREQFHSLATLRNLDDATPGKFNLVRSHPRRLAAKLDGRRFTVRLKPSRSETTRHLTHHFPVVDRTQDQILGDERDCQRHAKDQQNAKDTCNNPTLFVHKNRTISCCGLTLSESRGLHISRSNSVSQPNSDPKAFTCADPKLGLGFWRAEFYE